MTNAARPPAEADADLLRALGRILPPQRILRDTLSRRSYDCDALTLYRQDPMLVVLPETVEQVQAVARLSHERGIPLVPRGAGTGLSAGATPHADGILVSLAALDRVLSIDPLSAVARVEPGVSNLAISEAAAPHGLFYAPDPSSQIACSIGGNVAENSGGAHCLKYGLTVNNVLGVKLVTAAGELLEIGGAAQDLPGPDLLALVCGSEGLLGMVVEITVRLLPRPATTTLLVAGFSSVRAAATAVSSIIAAGIVPAALEMMDSLAIRAAEDFAGAGYPRDAAALLLCEIDGASEEVEAVERRCREQLRAAGADSVRVAHSVDERERLWRGRKSAFPAVGRISRDYYCMDGTIPRSRIGDVLEEISRLSEHYDLAVANVFHAGDGNLHPLILFDGDDPVQVRRAEEFGAAILEHSVRVGGCITGEHGVGLEKLAQMPVQFGEAELLQFEDIKAAFDPRLLLNPGKGIPILRRCQEYRGLGAAE